MKVESNWDFVEKYYPNYSSCDEVAYNQDLVKILEEEVEGCVETLNKELERSLQKRAKEKFGFFLNEADLRLEVIEKVTLLLDQSFKNIYEKAIKGYIETLNN
jgi:predicted metal-dependent hydrolase